MTLLTVVKDVCAAVGVTVPSSVISGIATNRTMQEMLSLANEMAQRIAYDTRDWQGLLKRQVMTGNGSTPAYDMPADYKRMLLTANVWRSTSAVTPMMYIADYEEWLNRRAFGYVAAQGEWTRVGDQILLSPTLATGTTAYFVYLDKNCVKLAGGGNGDSFVADGDSFRLDERVLKLGMIWQWKANKGGAYAEDLSTYGDAIAKAQGNDKPAPTLIGRLPKSQVVTASYPFPLPS